MNFSLDTAEGLKADTEEADPWDGPRPDLGRCWKATRGGACRYGYVRVWLWIGGADGRQKPFTSHILAWLLDHLGPMSRDDLFLAYCELRASGLVIDHICENPGCRRPSHLQPLTQSENIAAGKERQYQRDLARGPIVHYESDEALEF